MSGNGKGGSVARKQVFQNTAVAQQAMVNGSDIPADLTVQMVVVAVAAIVVTEFFVRPAPDEVVAVLTIPRFYMHGVSINGAKSSKGNGKGIGYLYV